MDVSLALPLVQATYEQRYEVAIMVNQDADFCPAVLQAKTIARGGGEGFLGPDGCIWARLVTTPVALCGTTGHLSPKNIDSEALSFSERPPASMLTRYPGICGGEGFGEGVHGALTGS